jgi:outer membrane protein TolC
LKLAILFFFGFSVKLTFATPPEVQFSDFYKEMLKKNDIYIGAVLAEKSALERKEGGVALYIPSVSISRSQSSFNDFESNRSKVFRDSLNLNGRVPELGINYSSTVYSNTFQQNVLEENHSGDYQFNIGVELLRDFGPRVGRIPFDILDLNYSISKIQKLRTIYSLSKQLLASYMNAYFNLENLKINEDSLSRNMEDLRKSKEQFKAGKIPKLSLISLQNQNKQIQNSLIFQERSLRDSIINLYKISSTDEDLSKTPFKIKLQNIQTPLFRKDIIDGLLVKEIDFKNLKNIDYLLAQNNMQRAKLSLKQAKNNLYPSLTLNYSVTGQEITQNRTGLLPNDATGNTVSLSLSMPIGLVAERREYAASLNEFNTVGYSFSQLKRDLTRDWENLKEQYQLISKQLEISKELVAIAKEQYEASLPTSSLGPTYQQNIIFFLNDWVNAQINYNRVLVEVINVEFDILAFHIHPHLIEVFSKFSK